jgi:hypothetical protein
MIYALDESGDRIKPWPSKEARCPHCKGEVTPKCGSIKAWHWAHRDVEDCDEWGEPETEWHVGWKESVPSRRAEVTKKRGGETHRADLVLSGGTVVELQHSSISPEEIADREAFYDSMVWLFDIREFSPPCDGDPRFIPREKDGYHSFRWKHPRKHIAYTSAPTYLDMGPRIMRLKDMHPDAPCGGWGEIESRAVFVEWLNSRAVE